MQNHTCNERQKIGQEGCGNNRSYSVLLNGRYKSGWEISEPGRMEEVTER